MRIALFAADRVGRDIVSLFAERQLQPDLLVLDAADPLKLNTELQTMAKAKGVLLSDSLSSEETLNRIRALGLDLGILAWWPYLLKPSLISLSRSGFLNFHPSLLPYNRGKHPNFWSLVEGTPYGVTLHFITPQIDAGEIAYQRSIPTGWEDTAKTLHEKGKQTLVELFRDHFDEIVSGRIPRRAQDLSAGTFHLGKELEPASEIDLDKTYSGRSLLNLLRARTYPPHPGAWFSDDGETYEVRIEIRKRTR